MAEPAPPEAKESTPTPSSPPRSSDDVALELMKFIAVSTGYGRSSQPAAGFSGKPVTRSPEEHAEALLELFERCRRVVRKES
jgi:hypothetical protein